MQDEEAGLMARRHPRILREAGISPARYRELQDICAQYREYRRMIAMVRAGIEDRRGHGSAWHRPDPTGEKAVRLAAMAAEGRIRMIDTAATRVGGPVVGRAILRSVTERIDYDRLSPPLGRKQFYALRLWFFVELDRALWQDI